MRRPAIRSTQPSRLARVAAALTLAALLPVLAAPSAAARTGTTVGPGAEARVGATTGGPVDVTVPGEATAAGQGDPTTEGAARLGDPGNGGAVRVGGGPTTAQLAQRLDRETARLHEAVAAATAAQRAAEDVAGQALLLAVGGLIVGTVGLIVGALAWGKWTAATAGPDVALIGAGKG